MQQALFSAIGSLREWQEAGRMAAIRWAVTGAPNGSKRTEAFS